MTPSFERFLQWVHPEDRALVKQAHDGSVRDRQTYNVVHRVLLPDGRVKYMRERGVTECEGERPVRGEGVVGGGAVFTVGLHRGAGGVGPGDRVRPLASRAADGWPGCLPQC